MDRQMPQPVEIAQRTETHDWQLLSGNGWKLLETGLETSFWKRGNLSLDLCNILIFLWKLLWKQHAFQNAQVIEFVKESTCQSCCQPKEVSREKVVQVAELMRIELFPVLFPEQVSTAGKILIIRAQINFPENPLTKVREYSPI